MTGSLTLLEPAGTLPDPPDANLTTHCAWNPNDAMVSATASSRRQLECWWICALTAIACAQARAEPWDYWMPHHPDDSQLVDHRPWQAFLDRYVVMTEDGRTLVRYPAVSGPDRNALRDYLESLAAIDPRTLRRDEQYAYWINLYNALTVEVVLRNPGKTTIKRMGEGLFSLGPWDDELIEIAGRSLTLNDIEHRILRPIWQDRRVHFALNCASVGCPNLAREVYTSASVERLLDAGEAAFLAHPRGLRFDTDGELHLSSIFDWYRDDFAPDRAGLLRYLAGLRPELAGQLLQYAGRIRYDYDWSLNTAE